MKISNGFVLKSEGPVSISVDLSQVSMTEEQAQIVAKLLGQIQDKDIPITLDLDSSSECEEGNCLASQYLANDEFAKIRHLTAALNPSDTVENVAVTFCLKWVAV